MSTRVSVVEAAGILLTQIRLIRFIWGEIDGPVEDHVRHVAFINRYAAAAERSTTRHFTSPQISILRCQTAQTGPLLLLLGRHRLPLLVLVICSNIC